MVCRARAGPRFLCHWIQPPNHHGSAIRIPLKLLGCGIGSCGDLSRAVIFPVFVTSEIGERWLAEIFWRSPKWDCFLSPAIFLQAMRAAQDEPGIAVGSVPLVNPWLGAELACLFRAKMRSSSIRARARWRI